MDLLFQSINQCHICSNEIHREFMPAIHRKSLFWLILTFSTSPLLTAGTRSLSPLSKFLFHNPRFIGF
jgi:hypothetical protein